MTIKYDPATGVNTFTDWDRVRLWVVTASFGIGAAGVLVGLFFLRSYRWGGCP